MQLSALSTRPFIGAKDYAISRSFYQAMGFTVTEVATSLSVCTNQNVVFYLQDYYDKAWIENTMLFIEVEDLDKCHQELNTLDLPGRFAGVRLSGIKQDSWGRECFLHDPSGILWHFGHFIRP
jgi:hypothetical protein